MAGLQERIEEQSANIPAAPFTEDIVAVQLKLQEYFESGSRSRVLRSLSLRPTRKSWL